MDSFYCFSGFRTRGKVLPGTAPSFDRSSVTLREQREGCGVEWNKDVGEIRGLSSTPWQPFSLSRHVFCRVESQVRGWVGSPGSPDARQPELGVRLRSQTVREELSAELMSLWYLLSLCCVVHCYQGSNSNIASESAKHFRRILLLLVAVEFLCLVSFPGRQESHEDFPPLLKRDWATRCNMLQEVPGRRVLWIVERDWLIVEWMNV